MGMDPLTIAAIYATTQVAKGFAEKKAGDNQASQFRKQADAERSAGKAREEKLRRDARKMLGRQLVASGASGFSVEGSTLDILAMTAAENELAAQTELYNTEVKASGFLARASEAKQAGKAALFGSVLDASTALLGAQAMPSGTKSLEAASSSVQAVPSLGPTAKSYTLRS
jgi:hypothetical protein